MGRRGLARRRDALALIRQWLDLDARAAEGGAATARDVSSSITKLTVGNTDVSVSPGQRRPRAHRENARKIAHGVEEVFFESRGESIPAEVLPNAVLFTERASAVRAEQPAAA